MKLVVCLLQSPLVNVRVDLGRGDVGVPKHLLDHTQIATVFQEVRGETMAKRVRRDVLGDTRGARIFLNEMPNRLATELRPAAREKHFAAKTTIFLKVWTSIAYIPIQAFDGLLAHGHDAFLAAFADGAQEASLEVDLAQRQLRYLAHAQPRRVH